MMGEPPPALLAMPELDYRQFWYWQAFNEISSSRPYSMAGPLPITLGNIRDYCDMFQVSDLEQRTSLVRLVRAIDSEYLERILKPVEDDKAPDRGLRPDAP